MTFCLNLPHHTVIRVVSKSHFCPIFKKMNQTTVPQLFPIKFGLFFKRWGENENTIWNFPNGIEINLQWAYDIQQPILNIRIVILFRKFAVWESKICQHTVKSRAVDRSTIQFLRIFGMLLTEMCYEPRVITIFPHIRPADIIFHWVFNSGYY